MEGLDHFLFMIWSKFRVPQSSKEEQLLSAFRKRFGHALPLQYIDLVVVEGVELEKERKVETDEQPKDPVSE